MFKDIELADQLQVYLEEKSFKPNEIPAQPTLLKILANLPAKTTKAMAGIDDLQEKAMRSFEDLVCITKDLKQYGLPKEHSDDLISCIAASKTYLKLYYKGNLDIHSDIASHCVSYALSDQESKEFNVYCPEGDEHNKKCSHCEAINDLFQSIRGVVKKYHGQKTSLEFREMLHKIEQASQNIYDYRGHIVRTLAQSFEWDKLREEVKPNVAFATLDWAMKVKNSQKYYHL